MQSLPTWGAWIETTPLLSWRFAKTSRSPRGERGLKQTTLTLVYVLLRRSPRGERGLKQPSTCHEWSQQASLPTWGAWIETVVDATWSKSTVVAPHVGSVD